MSGSPANFEAQLRTALSLHEQGHLDAAEKTYQAILSHKPDHLPALLNLGSLSLGKAQWSSAEAYFNKASALDNTNANLFYLLGVACQQQNQREQAASCYQKALSLDDSHPHAYTNLGILYQEEGNLDEAIRCYRQALSIKPNLAEVYANLAFVLCWKEQYPEALAACQQALSLKPDFPAAYVNLGCIHHAQGNLDEAIAAYQAAIALNPGNPSVYHNLGLVFHQQGELPQAIASHQQALALKNDYPEAHFSLAVLQLLNGEYQTGWKAYEWRIAARQNRNILTSIHKPWTGALESQAQISDLILLEEQGIGDILQFLRYGKLLKKTFSSVSLAVREPLIPLIEMTGIFDQIYSIPLPAEDRKQTQYAYLLSLPGILGVTPDEPLITEPYLKSDPIRTSDWRQKVHTSGSFIIGLNWQGDPATEKTEFKGRSFPLATFEPLAAIPGVQFVSLQKGLGSEQLENCTFRERFVACQDEISNTWDWTETAAIAQSCDLIITSDTSIAHLAGGLGKPTWILLKKIPDWRWGLTREHSHWYPSARLFRQKEAGRWAEVILQVKHELCRLIQHS